MNVIKQVKYTEAKPGKKFEVQSIKSNIDLFKPSHSIGNFNISTIKINPIQIEGEISNEDVSIKHIRNKSTRNF